MGFQESAPALVFTDPNDGPSILNGGMSDDDDDDDDVRPIEENGFEPQVLIQ
jgi:hypothetical protein